MPKFINLVTNATHSWQFVVICLQTAFYANPVLLHSEGA